VISDLRLALASEAAYSAPSQTWGNDRIHVFLTSYPDNTRVIAFRGSHSVSDWLIDFEAVPVSERGFHHSILGEVHLGWWQDVQSVADPILEWMARQSKPVACTGHSKGAGEALIFAALAITKSFTWSRVSTFGTPHTGALGGLVTSTLGCDYRNRDDPVPLVPWYLGRPRPLTEVKAPLPKGESDMDPFSDHHVRNYVAAMRLQP
jgi:hypothetical protein